MKTAMMELLKSLILNILLLIDKHIVKFIKVEEVTPNEKTQKSLIYLSELSAKALENDVLFWITGSWAITMLSGKYFKQINDIDLTTKNSELSKLSEILIQLGYSKGESKWPDMHFFEKDGIDIEFFSVEDKNHIFSEVPLTDCVVTFNNQTYRILEPSVLYTKYLKILLHKKRNAKADLVKLKILKNLANESYN